MIEDFVYTFTNEQLLWIAERSDKQREPATRMTVSFYQLEKGFTPKRFARIARARRTRIADTIYFGDPYESLALQLADVCCSTITRFLLAKFYGRHPEADAYYDILRPHVLNHGFPVQFRSSAGK
jgi:hypothetical protein